MTDFAATLDADLKRAVERIQEMRDGELAETHPDPVLARFHKGMGYGLALALHALWVNTGHLYGEDVPTHLKPQKEAS